MEAAAIQQYRHPARQRRVIVYSDMGSVIYEGQYVTLYGEISGFERLDVSFQWQFDDGMGWKDVIGANRLTHTYLASQQTINYSWRLCVNEKRG